MVLHTIIGEYDVLYAQEREFAFVKNPKQEIMSTNPADFLLSTQPVQFSNTGFVFQAMPQNIERSTFFLTEK